MPLASGTKLGRYEIVSPIGSGGMGEVYRARDPRIGREVAIKVLPAEVADDPDRLRRLSAQRVTGRTASITSGLHLIRELTALLIN